MNYRHILSFLSVCFLGASVSLQAYPDSVSRWKLPGGEQVVTVGECHIPVESDPEYVDIIKNTAEAFKSAQVPLSVQLEANLPPTALVGTESADDRGIISFEITDCRGAPHHAFWHGLEYLRKINFGFHACFSDQDYSQEVVNQLPALREIFKKTVNNRFLQETKQTLINAIDKDIVRITNTLQNNDDELLRKCLIPGIEYRTDIASFFEECSDDTSIIDCLFDLCMHYKSIDPLLNTWQIKNEWISDHGVLRGYSTMVDAGFIMEIQRATEDHRNVLLYAGDAHIGMVNQYLKETLNAELVDTIQLEIITAGQEKTPKPISIKDFADFCKKFQESSFAPSKKRKREAQVASSDDQSQALEQHAIEQSTERETEMHRNNAGKYPLDWKENCTRV